MAKSSRKANPRLRRGTVVAGKGTRKAAGTGSEAGLPLGQHGLPLPLYYLGVDPGVSGGLVLASVLHGELIIIDTLPMPETDAALYSWVRVAADAGTASGTFACLEKISAAGFPGSGKWQTGTVHGSYRACRMALAACGVPFVEKVAHSWQKALGIEKTKDGETYTEFKTRLRDYANARFPGAGLTKAVCDAALICLFSRNHREGLT